MSDAMLGRLFANCGSDEQAEFLNVAGRDMRRTCLDRFDVQCCWIVDHLDGNGRDLVKRLAEFIRVDEETPRVEKRIVYEDVIVKREIEAEDDAP